jgi:hypothetical protein
VSLLQFRRNTASYWTAQNIVPNVGEPVYGTDTGELAVGDGGTRWSALPKLLTDVRAAALYIGRSLMGAAGGVATLDGSAILTAGQSRAVHVTHGSVSTVARPAAPAGVPAIWWGTIRPGNAATNDVLFNTSAHTIELCTGPGAWVTLGGGGAVVTGTAQIADEPTLSQAIADGNAGLLDNVELVIVQNPAA